MDKELLDGLIKVVIEDKERINVYEHLDKLLLTFTDEEIDYFLDCCDEDLFLNYNLSLTLAMTIPEKMREYVELFVENKLQIINFMEESLINEYRRGRISKEIFDETMREYVVVREEAEKFRTSYMIGIEKGIK
jgi:hypothetical protein